MTQAPEKLWAYLVYQLVVDAGLLELDSSYIPEPSVNSIIITGDNHGKGAKAVEFEDGPVKTYADLIFLGEGEKDPITKKISFDLGTQRLLNLINIGLENEAVLRAQIHEFAERIQTKLEPLLVSPVKNDDFVGDVLRTVDDVEKHFWDRKR